MAAPKSNRAATSPTQRKPSTAATTTTAPKPLPYARHPAQPRVLPNAAPKPVDRNSVAYKQAASKYVRVMIAMPILLVTSYVLYDRLMLGTKAKDIHSRPSPEEVAAAIPPPAKGTIVWDSGKKQT